MHRGSTRSDEKGSAANGELRWEAVESLLETNLLGCVLEALGAGLESEEGAGAGGEAGDVTMAAAPPALPGTAPDVVTAASAALRRTRRALC